MTDPFASPGGNKIEWADYLGKLLIFWPLEFERDIETKDYGKKDAIRADIVCLDADDGPEDIPDILVFPLVLQGQLRRLVGKDTPIIGRLDKEKDEVDSKGRVIRQGAWKLVDATAAERKVGSDYLSGRPQPPKKDQFGDVPF